MRATYNTAEPAGGCRRGSEAEVTGAAVMQGNSKAGAQGFASLNTQANEEGAFDRWLWRQCISAAPVDSLS